MEKQMKHTIKNPLHIKNKLLMIIGMLILLTPTLFAGGISETLSISDYPNPILVTHDIDVTNQQQVSLTVQQYLNNWDFSPNTSEVSPTIITFSAGSSGSVYDRTAATTAVAAVTNAPATPSTGTAHTINVMIDTYNWVPSGEYEDNLVFEISGTKQWIGRYT